MQISSDEISSFQNVNQHFLEEEPPPTNERDNMIIMQNLMARQRPAPISRHSSNTENNGNREKDALLCSNDGASVLSSNPLWGEEDSERKCREDEALLGNEKLGKAKNVQMFNRKNVLPQFRKKTWPPMLLTPPAPLSATASYTWSCTIWGSRCSRPFAASFVAWIMIVFLTVRTIQYISYQKILLIIYTTTRSHVRFIRRRIFLLTTAHLRKQISI
jgi:hypothetical protein